MSGFVVWLGIGVFIGAMVAMIMGVSFVAWNEEQERKKHDEFDD